MEPSLFGFHDGDREGLKVHPPGTTTKAQKCPLMMPAWQLKHTHSNQTQTKTEETNNKQTRHLSANMKHRNWKVNQILSPETEEARPK